MSNVPLKPLHEFSSVDDAYPTALARRIGEMEERGENQLTEIANRVAVLNDAVKTLKNGELLRKDLEMARFSWDMMSEWLGALSRCKEQAAMDAAGFAIRSEKVGGFSDKKQP